MRSLAFATVSVGVLLASAPALAQIYDPAYPVCMHVHGEMMGERMDCIFTSLAQCKASAVGVPATCLMNPYYASARKATQTRPNRRRAW
jgi:hypothetical protein